MLACCADNAGSIMLCCALGVCLDPQHVAGVRNEWADDLSRNRLEGFNPARRVRINARTLTLRRVVVTHLDSWGLDQFFDRAGKVGLLGCHPAGPPGRIDQAY